MEISNNQTWLPNVLLTRWWEIWRHKLGIPRIAVDYQNESCLDHLSVDSILQVRSSVGSVSLRLKLCILLENSLVVLSEYPFRHLVFPPATLFLFSHVVWFTTLCTLACTPTKWTQLEYRRGSSLQSTFSVSLIPFSQEPVVGDDRSLLQHFGHSRSVSWQFSFRADR